jgi:hypothetical protein
MIFCLSSYSEEAKSVDLTFDSLLNNVNYVDSVQLTTSSDSLEDSTMILKRIDPVRAALAGAFSVGSIYLASVKFKEVWGRSDEKKWRWKWNDWDHDGLVQSDEMSHFMAGQRGMQLARGLLLWLVFLIINRQSAGD